MTQANGFPWSSCGSASGVISFEALDANPLGVDPVRSLPRSTISRFVRMFFLAGTAGAAATAGTLFFPASEDRRPGSVAHVWVDTKRRRRSISAGEARAIALLTLEDSRRRLSAERACESAFLMRVWEDGEEFISA